MGLSILPSKWMFERDEEFLIVDTLVGDVDNACFVVCDWSRVVRWEIIIFFVVIVYW